MNNHSTKQAWVSGNLVMEETGHLRNFRLFLRNSLPTVFKKTFNNSENNNVIPIKIIPSTHITDSNTPITLRVLIIAHAHLFIFWKKSTLYTLIRTLRSYWKVIFHPVKNHFSLKIQKIRLEINKIYWILKYNHNFGWNLQKNMLTFLAIE